MYEAELGLLESDPTIKASEEFALSQRPYIATDGPNKGRSVITVNTGRLDRESGLPIYTEQRIFGNATLRKDEWINLDIEIIEAARRRLVVVKDLQEAGLAIPVGGLGTIISEWEAASKMTDAGISMDGESKMETKDRQEFDLQGVPIPVIKKPFRIGKRTLLASQRRGATLDTTQQIEAARAVARTSERLVFEGANIGEVNSAGNRYRIWGLTNFPGRATANISNWADNAVTPETILGELLGLVQQMETQERHFGPFKVYIPGNMMHQFRLDYKAFGERTLMDRVLSERVIESVGVSDVLAAGNVCLVQMEKSVIDLGVASDITTIQWESGSGWSSHFQVYAAWAPRLKQDHDDHCGIMHATVA